MSFIELHTILLFFFLFHGLTEKEKYYYGFVRFAHMELTVTSRSFSDRINTKLGGGGVEYYVGSALQCILISGEEY